MKFDVAAIEADLAEFLGEDAEVGTEAEETVEETVEAEVEETVEEQEVEEIEVVDTEEAKARENGWVPKEEFKGKDWVDAKEFNKRGELFEKISSQNRTMKDLEKKIELLVQHNQKVEQKALERAIAKLKQERKEKIEYGEVEEVDRIEEEISELSKQKSLTTEQKPAKVEEDQSYIDDFTAKTPWFEKDEAMTDYMILKTQDLLNRGLTKPQAIQEAKTLVEAHFAHKLAPTKKQGSPVMKSGKVEAKPNMSYKNLTSDEKALFSLLKDSGLSEKEIFAQLGG